MTHSKANLLTVGLVKGKKCVSHSGVSDSLHGNLTQGSNSGVLYCRKILYHLSHQENTVLIAASGKENRQRILKRPEIPDAFQGRIFKGSMRERTMRYMNWVAFS